MESPHEKQRALLARAIQAGRLAHGYLFTGPEGAGKRTMAIELGKALLCEERSFPACGTCGACSRVSSGTHPDFHLLEPEGKTITIKSVRELSGKLHFHGFEGGARVGIIPEAERMKVETQNAFLKTLEEPPAGAVIVITTNNLSRILPTIISRCQTLRFGPMPTNTVKNLVMKERGLDEQSAELLAVLSQGNARKALALDLDFMVDFRRKVIQRLSSIDRQDLPAILDWAEQVAGSSHDDADIIDLIAGFYLDALHIKLDVPRVVNPDLAELARETALAMSERGMLRRLDALRLARARQAGNANNRLNWEILAMVLKGTPGAEITNR